MYTFQYNKKYYYSVYVSFFGEFMQNEILSLRAKQQAIKKFREQAKSESLTQGDFLEKILNVYLGIPIENSSIPFKIALFWINNLDKNDKNLDKKIYSGYGELLYSSSIFDYYLANFLTSTINQLTTSNLYSIKIPFTDNINEQNEIVEYLDKAVFQWICGYKADVCAYK